MRKGGAQSKEAGALSDPGRTADDLIGNRFFIAELTGNSEALEPLDISHARRIMGLDLSATRRDAAHLI